MVKIDIKYLGDLHCEVKHGPSGQTFLTDAPLDNNGNAEYISPTDLLAASVGSCIATIMGIKAKSENIDLAGMTISVDKEMVNQPFRRIGKLNIDIVFPHKLSDREFAVLSNVPKICPVTRSISNDVEINVNYSYK